MKKFLTEVKDVIVALTLSPIYFGMCYGTGKALREKGGVYTPEINEEVYRSVYEGLISKETIEATFAAI